MGEGPQAKIIFGFIRFLFPFKGKNGFMHQLK